jgi:cytidyltransferase-like protein
MTKVMVFGVFDGIHEGHRAMLKEAKEHGDFLIAVIAQDHIVEHLKGRLPGINLLKRFEHLEDVDSVDKVVIGDAELSLWNVVNVHAPHVIALGHDQNSLKEDIENNIDKLEKKPKIVVLKNYEKTAN